MNRLEMFAKLIENPKRKAKNNDGETAVLRKNHKSFEVSYEFSGDILHLILYDDETWGIIEPDKKLKEFCYGEAMWMYFNGDNIHTNKINSCISGKCMPASLCTMSLEEFKGKWTIDGYYEDEGE